MPQRGSASKCKGHNLEEDIPKRKPRVIKIRVREVIDCFYRRFTTEQARYDEFKPELFRDLAPRYGLTPTQLFYILESGQYKLKWHTDG